MEDANGEPLEPAQGRQNVALHATLETKQVTRIDGNTRDLVQLGDTVTSQLKFRGTTHEGIEVLADLELIGPPELLKQFKFEQGKHVGLVLRAID